MLPIEAQGGVSMERSYSPEKAVVPIYGQDPFVMYDEERDVFCLYQVNKNNEFTVREAFDVKDLLSASEKVVMETTGSSPWAPEVHKIGDRYYKYYTASVEDEHNKGQTENQRHRMYVAVSNRSNGSFIEMGEVFDSEHNYWAIDMTILQKEVNGEQKLYAIWSGWEGNPEQVISEYHINSSGDLRQNIYIAEMESPTKIRSGTTRLLSNPEYDWEANINEGPQILYSDNGDIWLVYSTGESWQKRYCQRAMILSTEDPLDQNAWMKLDGHLFNRKNIGHVSFVRDRDGKTYMFYHYKELDEGGWDDRKIKFAEIEFINGIPVMVETPTFDPTPADYFDGYIAA